MDGCGGRAAMTARHSTGPGPTLFLSWVAPALHVVRGGGEGGGLPCRGEFLHLCNCGGDFAPLVTCLRAPPHTPPALPLAESPGLAGCAPIPSVGPQQTPRFRCGVATGSQINVFRPPGLPVLPLWAYPGIGLFKPGKEGLGSGGPLTC
jgi:hypothetical protein